MITDVIKIVNNLRREETPINLSKAFGNPDLVREKMSEILRGLTIQHMEKIDNNFVDDIAEELFAEGFGFDLVSLNIQRGRDHGLPSYVDYRELCLGSRGKATSFDDLNSNINSAGNINSAVTSKYIPLKKNLIAVSILASILCFRILDV